MRRITSILTLLIITGGLTLLPAFSFAGEAATTVNTQYDDIQSQGVIFANICSGKDAACACRDTGSCTLDDILQVVVNVGTLILAISGSIFVLIMVYGGMTWILSQGKADMVTKGKGAMVAAFIGLAIIFGSYVAITLVISVLRQGSLPAGNLETVVGVCSHDGSVCSTDTDCGSTNTCDGINDDTTQNE